MVRKEQGKDLVAFLSEQAAPNPLPVIISGDFNAEPNESVYSTMLGNKKLRRVRSSTYYSGTVTL